MDDAKPAMTLEELRARCCHYNLCSCGAHKCLATYQRCAEENCPAFDAEDPVPLRLLIAEQAS